MRGLVGSCIFGRTVEGYEKQETRTARSSDRTLPVSFGDRSLKGCSRANGLEAITSACKSAMNANSEESRSSLVGATGCNHHQQPVG